MDGSTVPRRKPGVEIEAVGEHAVMLDSSGTVARGLNAMAVRVWELIDGRRSVRQIAQELHEDASEADVIAFLEALVARGLLA